MPVLPLPQGAYRPVRGQYDADELLDFLFDRLTLDVMRVIGVTERDLYAEGRNFVFGYAHMRDRVAVFSTLRLAEPYWGRTGDATLYRARVDKALAHEMGHTFHAPHCDSPACVMHQVEFLWQLDELGPEYCAACAGRVSTVARRGVHGAESLFELGGSYMRRRRYPRAAAAYAAAQAKDPANAHYANDLGVALLALGEKAQAARAFQKAIDLQPAFPHAYYNLGIVCRERGDQRTADHFFAEAVRRDEDPRQAHRYLGILHQDYFRDPERALAHLERFTVLGGDDADVRRRLVELRREPAVAVSGMPV
jgi:archaemetzincin